MTTDLASLTSLARQTFAQLASVRLDGALLDLGLAGIRAKLDVVDTRPGPLGPAVHLRLELTGGPFRQPLPDTFAAAGETTEAAIQQAVQSWVDGPLELLREAVASPHETTYDLTQSNPTTQRTHKWGIFAGPLQIASDEALMERIYRALDEKPLFERLHTAKALPVLEPGRVHLVKLFAMRAGIHGPVLGECKVDGEPVESAAKVLAGVELPTSSAHQFVRQYLLFVPADA